MQIESISAIESAHARDLANKFIRNNNKQLAALKTYIDLKTGGALQPGYHLFKSDEERTYEDDGNTPAKGTRYTFASVYHYGPREMPHLAWWEMGHSKGVGALYFWLDVVTRDKDDKPNNHGHTALYLPRHNEQHPERRIDYHSMSIPFRLTPDHCARLILGMKEVVEHEQTMIDVEERMPKEQS